jgi:hypothetical protein
MSSDLWKQSPFGTGSIFHPDYGKSQDEKILQIKHLSTRADETNYIMLFEISTKGLKNLKATIFVAEVEVVLDEMAVPPTTIQLVSTGNQRVTMRFRKNKQFSKTVLEGEFEFKATITCDGLSAETEEFRLKIENNLKLDDKQLFEKSDKIYAKETNWSDAVNKLKINDVNLLKAVAYQESYLEPFIGQHTKILYERHRFYSDYSKKHNDNKALELSKIYPNLINKKSGGYGNENFFDKNTGKFDKIGANDHQFERLNNAKKIDLDIAIKSTSFGIFQLMGENYIYTSNSPIDFFNGMEKSEIFQIEATVNFLLGDKAKKEFSNAINSKKWELVASIYNGEKWKIYNPSYAKNLEKYYKDKPWEK